MVHRPACGGRPRRIHSQNTHESGVLRAIDCSPFIDNLFAGSPINNRRYPAHLLVNSDGGSCRYWLRKGD
jgi:hypothetical protein